MRLIRRSSIQLKLIAILLLATAASVLIVGWIAYSSGEASLTRAAFDRLTSVRATKEVQIEAYFRSLRRQVANLAGDLMIISATRELDDGFNQNNAADGSAYLTARARYNAIFAKFVQDFHYDNLIMIDSNSGTVIYTLNDTPLLGSNLLTGPFSVTAAADLFRRLRRATTVGDTEIADFAPTPYEHNQPLALMGAAIFDGPKQIGVMLLEFPVDEINRVMTDDFAWVADGLGRTGEVYLVGPDRLMRSRSRLLHEAPALYFQQLQAAGYPADVIARVRRAGTATLSQPVRTQAVELALSGRTGTTILTNYRGVRVLSSYAPIHAAGLRWVVVAEMEQIEAFAPLINLSLMIIICSLDLIVVAAIVAALLARGFGRPILRLLNAVDRLEAGEKNVSVRIGTTDEFADLGEAFNHLSHTLTATADSLAQRTRERDELVANVLPPPAAARARHGQPHGLDQWTNLVILHARIVPPRDVGWTNARDDAAALADLVDALDAAAARLGIEKLSDNGAAWLACSGLGEQCDDDARRVVDFAQDMLAVAEHLRREDGTKARIRIGIDAGPVVGGVLGRMRLAYQLSGEAVAVAAALSDQAAPDSILVSDRVHATLPDRYRFAPAERVPRAGGAPLIAWLLSPATGDATAEALAPSAAS